MDNKKLIESGVDISQILIDYLSKDAMGSSFLKNYLINQESLEKSTQKQKESLEKIVQENNRVSETTFEVSKKSELNNEQLEKIFETISELGKSVAVIEAEYIRYNEQFKTFMNEIAEINKLVDSIKQISSRTNLLSFNASIEAARAGNAGKGFRIIANEVKKLSDETNSTSETIKNHVTQLVTNISELEKATVSNSQSLRNLAEKTESTVEQFDNVRIANSDVNNQVRDISGQIKQNNDNITDLISMVESIEDSSNSTSKGFAQSASQNEMLFNDFYSYAYEIKAIFEKLKAEN